MPAYVKPEPLGKVFTCPHCDVTATQSWYGNRYGSLLADFDDGEGTYSLFPAAQGHYNEQISEWAFVECSHCKKMSVWHGHTMVLPAACLVGEPNGDMPGEVAEVYREAAVVVSTSPRAAAALLRLGLQILLKKILGSDSTGEIYEDIELLRKRNLSPFLLEALDIVRINGNESVHPGIVNLNENPDDALYLFEILNIVCEYFFTHPRRMEEAYLKLPEKKRMIKPGSVG